MKTLLATLALLIALLPTTAGAQTQHADARSHMRTVERAGWTIEYSSTWFEATKDGQTVSMDDFLYRDSMDCMEWTESGKLLSIVGTVVTFEWSMYAYCGGAHGWADTKFIAIDLSRGGKAVTPADLFGKKTVQTALERSPEWKQSRNEGGVYQCVLLHEDNTIGGPFAFHRLDDNAVAVRIGVGEHLSEACRGTLVEVELYLPVPDKLAADLRRADEEGTLMEDLYEPVEGC
jgi:hypothetical protein